MKKIKGVYIRSGTAYIRYLDAHGELVRESVSAPASRAWNDEHLSPRLKQQTVELIAKQPSEVAQLLRRKEWSLRSQLPCKHRANILPKHGDIRRHKPNSINAE